MAVWTIRAKIGINGKINIWNKWNLLPFPCAGLVFLPQHGEVLCAKDTSSELKEWSDDVSAGVELLDPCFSISEKKEN